MPSRHEGQAIVLLEAAALGKPAVVSDIPTLRWAVRAGFAASARPGDPMHLADVIVSLFRDDRRRHELGARAREYARARTWTNVALDYERYLLGVVGGSR